MEKLSFIKCYFCCKNFNKLQLIEMNEKTVLIDEEEVTYHDLVFDVCMFKMNSDRSSYVCIECNNNLLSFHFFKRDAKKYADFRRHIEKLEVLSKAELFLDSLDTLDEIQFAQEDDKFVISLPTKCLDDSLNYHEETKLEDEIGALYEIIEESAPTEDLSEMEEVSVAQAIEDLPDQDECEQLEERLLLLEDETASKKRKTNTLNDLTEKQIEYVRRQVAASEVSKGNTKKPFACNVCHCQLSTQASLTRHIRDVHVLKEETDEKKALKAEVESSKLIIETTAGSQTLWKCQRCEADRVYKCLQAFKLHLRMTHLRPTKIDKALVAACSTYIIEGSELREVWKCPDCSRISRHRETFRHHIKTVHPNMDENEAKERIRLEAEAKSKSLNQEDVDRIANKFTGENKAFRKSANNCFECGLKFDTAKHYLKPKVHKTCHEMFKVLASHMVHHKCESCRIIFNSEECLSEHLFVHDDPKNVTTFEATGLSQIGAEFFQAISGDADNAVDEAVWKCGHCHVRYFDENSLVVHIMLLHTNPLHCFIDNREFAGSSGMSKFTQHMKNKHPELFPNATFPCGSCHAEFPNVYEKLGHQKICPSKKLECDYCGKRFLTKHQLQAHILYEIGLTGFSCEFCGKRCKTHSDLKIHQNVHTAARPYECSLCPKTFKTPGARSTHMEGHNDGITCEICGQKLANRTIYKRHKQFQHNQAFRENQLEKNQCHLCGKSFVRSSFFRIHMKQQHEMQLS